MKALIFNSGTGSRMGHLTKECPKGLLKLPSGESIFSRQLRILAECGIREVIVTTGKYGQELMAEGEKHPMLHITYVNNPLYESTNYIYSMYLAGEHLHDDILMLHGDLVFEKQLLLKLIEDERESLCLINKQADKPQKDFKGRVVEERLTEVSVHIFDENCYALQPLYKLSRDCMDKWRKEVALLVSQGRCNIYAEDAFNRIAAQTDIRLLSYEDYYITEIDTPKDYASVLENIIFYDEQHSL
ncbi:MAG: NTP transferase domain-containing protein [Lachnospiraceae bacterium]|nr:NTP transferase domain-containing protein [Lachnospiraceae bacterium]